MSDFFYLLYLSLIGSVIALMGGIFFLTSKRWSVVLEQNAIPFAAGVLITVSILGLLPESVENLGVGAYVVFLISFFTAYIFEHFLVSLHHHRQEGHSDHKNNIDIHSSVPLVIIGDTIHNFIDGVAIGASFFINPGLGFITAFSTFLHEVPHEIGDFGVLLKAGWKKRDVFIVNLLSSLVTIIGAFSTFLIAANGVFIGILLSVSAGMFLYLGAIDFLPSATFGFKNRMKALIPLVLGITIMVITLLLIPHVHE